MKLSVYDVGMFYPFHTLHFLQTTLVRYLDTMYLSSFRSKLSAEMSVLVFRQGKIVIVLIKAPRHEDIWGGGKAPCILKLRCQMEVNGQLFACHFTPGILPFQQEGCIIGLDALKKKKHLACARNRTQIHLQFEPYPSQCINCAVWFLVNRR